MPAAAAVVAAVWVLVPSFNGRAEAEAVAAAAALAVSVPVAVAAELAAAATLPATGAFVVVPFGPTGEGVSKGLAEAVALLPGARSTRGLLDTGSCSSMLLLATASRWLLQPATA